MAEERKRRRRVKTEDKRSKARIGCAELLVRNSRYLWSCVVNGKLIIEQKAMNINMKDYDKKSAARMVELQEAVNAHRH